MQGNLYYIAESNNYGFITGTDEEEYFFHKKDLLNCKVDDLYEGDLLEFTEGKNEKGLCATNIRKIGGVQIGQNGNVSPGINPLICLDHFSKAEKHIISELQKIFYITNGGKIIKIGQSTYKYCLAKPTSVFSEQFNLQREIIIVFSDYLTFEPRSLDAAAQVIIETQRSTLRVERICNILISSDPNIELKIRDLLKNDLDMQVVVPFTYQEFENKIDENKILNRFREFFFDRDLFAQSAPIQKDLYFFGRRDYVQSLVNRAMTGEHSGVFGLRRSGKTSVLYAIKRALTRNKIKSILIDCQKMHLYRWNEVLYELLKDIATIYNQKINYTANEFTEKRATSLFHQELNRIIDDKLVILFDEIEHLTFDISITDHWKNGKDFILFWQAIRSFYQTYPNKIAVIIAGTNPKINETPIIAGYDNPMYEQLTNDTFLPAFDLQHTSEMVKKLGGYMGMNFSDEVCTYLTTDFGGHPFLIRRVCSSINKYAQKKLSKPLNVTKAIYNQAKNLFISSEADRFCELILHVLIQSYANEYAALKHLALSGDYSEVDTTILSHLLGYNIVYESNGVYDFKIEIIKDYLNRTYKFENKNLSQEEKRTEISIRRNKVEQNLRKIIKTQLLSKYNQTIASQRVIVCLEAKYQAKATSLSYNDLFNPHKNNIFFKDLAKIIENNWGCFVNIFNQKKQFTMAQLNIINDLRVDCHAIDISDTEFATFRAAITWLEKILEPFI